MQTTTLSKLIRQGFEQEIATAADWPGRLHEPLLAHVPVRELPRLLSSPAVPTSRKDALLAAVIRCYRCAPCGPWSAVLLEMLAPRLVAVSSRLLYVPEGLDAEDVEQQVVAEALLAARRMPMGERSRKLGERLERRVMAEMVCWLIGILRSRGEDLERLMAEGASYRSRDELFLAELRECGVSREALFELSRWQVDRPVRERMIEIGVSITAASRRRQRIQRSLRKWRRAKFGHFADEIPAEAPMKNAPLAVEKVGVKPGYPPALRQVS